MEAIGRVIEDLRLFINGMNKATNQRQVVNRKHFKESIVKNKIIIKKKILQGDNHEVVPQSVNCNIVHQYPGLQDECLRAC